MDGRNASDNAIWLESSVFFIIFRFCWYSLVFIPRNWYNTEGIYAAYNKNHKTNNDKNGSINAYRQYWI